MYSFKHQTTRPHMGLLKGIVLLLCLSILFSLIQADGIAKAAENTVTVTVNYVYKSNNAMVAQPYTAQITKGTEFRKTLEIPKLFNYSIPADEALGLSNDIVLSNNDTTGNYTLVFDLDAVGGDTTVTLYYVAGTAKYTVYHYYQNLDDDTYSDQQPTVIELVGDIDTYTQTVADNKPGYHCKGVPQTTIAADGTTKVEIYYDRDYYTATFDVNGGIDGPEPIYAKYGTTFELTDINKPERKGYTFLGWQPMLSDTVTITGNMTYVAQWQPENGQADYTIVLWGQNANDDEYSYLRSHDARGNVGTQVTWNEDTLIGQVHMRDIKPYAALWEYDHSETTTVDANGSSVLNVYFKRTAFTLGFRRANSNSNNFGIITARWGKDIAREYNDIVAVAGSSFWSERSSGNSPWTNYIGVMPQRSINYYRFVPGGGTTNTMTYYGEDLNGTYTMIFSISFQGSGYTVTDEDRYEFEGFTYDHGTANGKNSNGAKFYYNRNAYALEFYSASNNETDKAVKPKYQEALGRYYYRPESKPTTVEPAAVFVGWYQNPECTGEEFDLASQRMPSNNIALYAKWVNGLYTIKNYTDDTMQTLYIYDGYTGVQTGIEKYTLAATPTPPTKDGYVFVGWFYKDGDTEKPFSFTMPITKDYDLYPKFSEPTAIEYTVHYYKAGTTEKIADDRINTVMIKTTVTEKAKMGADLNLLDVSLQNKYYPTNTSTSVIVNHLDQEIIFYYIKAASVSYTVYYQDANGSNLIAPVTKTTEYSTITTQYVPIANYAPRQFSITQDLSSEASQNKIIFIYDPTLTTLTIQKSGWDSTDENQTFLFRIKGMDENTKDIDLTVSVHENGKTTITDLPVGSYTVTEKTDWAWRYTPSGGETQHIHIGAGDAILPFANDRTENKWLNGDSYKVNHFESNQ